jgi:hypothetical protein
MIVEGIKKGARLKRAVSGESGNRPTAFNVLSNHCGRHQRTSWRRYYRTLQEVNHSTPQPKGRGLLEVHPEPGSALPLSKAGLRTAEWVNSTLPFSIDISRPQSGLSLSPTSHQWGSRPGIEESSSPGEFHPQALTDTDMTVSRQPALIIQLPSPATLPYPLAPPISG